MRFPLILACLALPAIGHAQLPVAAEATTAAMVNGQPITLAQVDAALAGQLPDVILTVAQRKDLRKTVLDDLIDDMLLKQFLAKNAPKVDHAADLEAQMKSLKALLLRQNRTLADYLKQMGQTEEQLREMWAMQLQLVDYVKTQATDEQLKAFHEANRDHFDRVEVRLSHIMIRSRRSALPAEREKAKERLQAVLDGMTEGVLVVEPDGGIVLANDRLRE